MYAGWERLTRSFPDREGVEAILGIGQFGARIGYECYGSLYLCRATGNDT